MIDIFNKCSLIENQLNTLKGTTILDFRIFLRTNENLYVYILINEDVDKIIIENSIYEIITDLEIEFLHKDDLEDNFYKQIFAKKEIINIEKGRRRFSSLLKNKNEVNYLTENNCPLITFYSYKGGMGRSTTLAAFAMHLSLVESFNVIIIDCDFEAPGFTNFFLKNAGEENQRQGFVEYFLDKASGLSSKEYLESYTWEVERKYTRDGTIRIMPAGNLDSKLPTNDFLHTNLNHYVEGLARIDFTNQEYIIQQFSDLVSDLKDSFKPDVILLDSRTGFSDVMGIAAFQLSKFILGFFRNDAQSLPGLTFFLQNMVERESLEPYLINSILPSSISLRKSIFNSFKEDVKNILEIIEEDSGLDFPCFPISRNENLEILGTTSEETDDFIEIVKNKEIKEYKDIFEHLSERIKQSVNVKDNNFEDFKEDIKDEVVEEIDILYPIITKESIEETNLTKAPGLDEINKADNVTKAKWEEEIREKILSATYEKITKTSLYAENLTIEDEFRNKQFFFRTCMNDLFNIDKSIILGSKGTGKSYIYNALKSKTIVQNLKERAKKTDNYHFVYTIDKKDRIFRVNKFEISKEKTFQYRFWLIYTWHILSKEIEIIFPTFSQEKNIEVIEIKDDETTNIKLKNLIKDDEYILKIEKEFNRLDDFLVETGNGKKEYLTILYDQLDEIVDPAIWNDWLPSLIDFWRYKRYHRIFGKLFIRKDLFRKLIGLNNINDIENQSIDIEWTQEEMVSYFFKIVFSNGMSDYFWSMMYLFKDYDSTLIKRNRVKYNNLEQISLDESLLRPLTTTFFGLNVDTNKTSRMGESYDWFFINLKNADDTISLRPFIDLIKFAIESWQKGTYKHQETRKPILFQKYYTDRDVRLKAVDRHFEDLVRNEIGNNPINYIFEHIGNSSYRFKQITLYKNNFEELLKNVKNEFEEEADMKNQTKKSLEELLINNGIVKKVNHGRGDEYKFAFLYKYKLGLRGI
jgi:cellulose biosynthesis protein BcsQ